MKHKEERDMKARMERYEMFFKKRYKVLYTVNDFMIGVLFLVGSFFFFSEKMKSAGIWLFVTGSFLLLIRPTIRLIHDFHYRKHLKKQYKPHKQAADHSQSFN
ncbi:YrhK family protein [Bacillus atrophaeus]